MSAAFKIEHYGWLSLKRTSVLISKTDGQKNVYPLRESVFFEQKHTSGVSSFVFNQNTLKCSAVRQKELLIYGLPSSKSWAFVPKLELFPFINCLQYLLLNTNVPR